MHSTGLMRNLSFRSKIFIVLLGSMLISLFVGAKISFNGFSRILEKELADKAVIITDQFAQRVCDLLVLEDENALRAQAASLAAAENLPFVAVYDKDYYPFVTISRLDVQLAPVEVKEDISRVVQTQSGQEFLEVITQVKQQNGTPAGFVRTLFPRTQIYEVLRTIFHTIVLITVVMIAFSVFIAYAGGIYLAGPINRIIASIRTVASNDYSHQIDPVGSPEFDKLIESYNTMMRQLNRTFDELNREIRERKEAERQLRNITDNLPNAALFQVITRPDGFRKFLHFSENVQSLCHVTAQAICRDSGAIYSLVHRDFADLLAAAESDAEKRQETFFCEVPFVLPDKAVRWFSISAKPQQCDGGETLWDGVMVDITGRKQAEQEREELIRMLEFKNTELQDIVYTASHDLRSPLVNIEGFSGELRADCGRFKELLNACSDGRCDTEQIDVLLNENIPQSLDFISRSTHKMVKLLDGLLQVSRVGSAELRTVCLDMNRTFGQVLATMAHQINESGAVVTVEPLPGCMGDAHMADRVFSNLITNALKYLDSSRKGDIHVSGYVEDKRSVYCVADNGIGIAAAHQRKIFEIFHRLHPAGEVEGEGLGLTIVNRILDRMDGRIWVESAVGQGSRFYVSLPACPRSSDS